MRSALALVLVLVMLTPLGMPVFGLEDITMPETTTENVVEPQAVNLILTFKLDAHKIDDSKLYVNIDLSCVPSVVKCGIKSVKLQRRANSSAKWETALSLDDMLVDGHSFTKKITFGATGHQYRLSVTFYAKKAWYSIQKMEEYSNVITQY